MEFPYFSDIATLLLHVTNMPAGTRMIASCHSRIRTLRPVGGKYTYLGCRRFISSENRYCRKVVHQLNPPEDLEDEDDVVRHTGACSLNALPCWRMEIELEDSTAMLCSRIWQATSYIVGGSNTPMFGKEFEALPTKVQETALARSFGTTFWFGLQARKSPSGIVQWSVLKASKTQQQLTQSSPAPPAHFATPYPTAAFSIKPVSLCDQFQQQCSKCSSLDRISSQATVGNNPATPPHILVKDSQRTCPSFSDLALGNHDCTHRCDSIELCSQNLGGATYSQASSRDKPSSDEIAIAAVEAAISQLERSRNLLLNELHRLKQKTLL